MKFSLNIERYKFIIESLIEKKNFEPKEIRSKLLKSGLGDKKNIPTVRVLLYFS